jgi:hypothetical protein
MLYVKFLAYIPKNENEAFEITTLSLWLRVPQ